MKLTNGEAREALKVAQGNLAAAEAALNAAVETADRARALLEGIVRESEALEASALRAAGAMAEAMRAAFLDGTSPPTAMSEKDHAKSAAARAAVELRRQAAEAIVADFAGAQREAEQDVESARAAVGAAIRGILRAEAESITAEWADLDESARAIRVRLGGAYGQAFKLGLGDMAYRAIELNDCDRVDLGEAAAVADAWNSFAADLAKDSEAKISFEPVDRAREEARAARDRVHASNESIAASLSAFLARPTVVAADSWADEMAMREAAGAIA
jgi:hypothetical protein